MPESEPATAFTPRQQINAELYKRVILNPPAWATEMDGTTPYFLTKHKQSVAAFLAATTDSVRLVRASKVSHEVLKNYDMAELEELRAHIQASELLRVIPYSQQTDHSAHTLYLYLLGIYLFFECKKLRQELARFLNAADESPRLVERFLFAWVFVSLLHDIGYIFQGRSRSEIRAADRMFRPSKITDLLDVGTYKAPADVKKSVRKFITELKIQPLESVQNPEDMISVLRDIPWGRYAEVNEDIFDSFSVYGLGPKGKNNRITGSTLETYAYQVASGGYNGLSEGVVDHAVASGLFLFRYSTLWYALAKDRDFDPPFEKYDDDYDKKLVACACFATAAHNLIGTHGTKYYPINFEENPLLYLGVLCDELQKWDRFPAGQQHLIDLASFEEHCTDSERIAVSRVTAEDGDSTVYFHFTEAKLAKRVGRPWGGASRANGTSCGIRSNRRSSKTRKGSSRSTSRLSRRPPTPSRRRKRRRRMPPAGPTVRRRRPPRILPD